MIPVKLDNILQIPVLLDSSEHKEYKDILEKIKKGPEKIGEIYKYNCQVGNCIYHDCTLKISEPYTNGIQTFVNITLFFWRMSNVNE